jgi:predicted acetyltransferase
METRDLRHGDESALTDFLSDFARAGEERIPAYFADPSWSHEETVRRFEAWSRGEDLDSGWVASSTLFLVEEGRILGVVNLRHQLNDHLLRTGGHVGFSVRPTERRKGHGTRLLEEAMDRPPSSESRGSFSRAMRRTQRRVA